VWTSRFNNFSCDITSIADQVGHAVQVMQYVNQTTLLGPAPEWSNAVYLRNYCLRRWDLVWSHQYVGPQTDCSQTFGVCGWWGPILETVPSSDGEPLPQINELGFEHTTLIHDDITSQLPPSEANFNPLSTPWNFFFLDPNQSYGAGNYFQQRRSSNDGG
jgi:hypothetical protein